MGQGFAFSTSYPRRCRYEIGQDARPTGIVPETKEKLGFFMIYGRLRKILVQRYGS